MRTIKTILILLLVVTTALFVFTGISGSLSGADVGPVISCALDTLDVSVADPEAVLLTGVTAKDKQDGDLTGQVMVSGVSKLITDNTAKVTYLVFDSDDNMGSLTRFIRYTDYQRPQLRVLQPLMYESTSGVTLTDRLGATDVIDGDISQSVRVYAMQETEMEDVYSVTVQVTNSMGDTARLDLPVVITGSNTNRPEIKLSEQLLYLQKGSTFEPRHYITSVDSPLEHISAQEVTVESSVDTQTEGCYWVVYRCTSGNSVGTAVLTVVVG